MKKIVSACLAGLHCRYDCTSVEREEIKRMVEKGEAVAFCPEQMGGLATPRPPAEIYGHKVITQDGHEVTQAYEKGAAEALLMTLMMKADEAYLKSKSPMCGAGKIYDGTFSGVLKEGDGVFTKLLKARGIKVHSVD